MEASQKTHRPHKKVGKDEEKKNIDGKILRIFRQLYWEQIAVVLLNENYNNISRGMPQVDYHLIVSTPFLQ